MVLVTILVVLDLLLNLLGGSKLIVHNWLVWVLIIILVIRSRRLLTFVEIFLVLIDDRLLLNELRRLGFVVRWLLHPSYELLGLHWLHVGIILVVDANFRLILIRLRHVLIIFTYLVMTLLLSNIILNCGHLKIWHWLKLGLCLFVWAAESWR